MEPVMIKAMIKRNYIFDTIASLNMLDVKEGIR